MSDKGLAEKVNLLPDEQISTFYDQLYSILNDRLSSLLYGGITKKEYPNPPQEKIMLIKERLYQEMFGALSL